MKAFTLNGYPVIRTELHLNGISTVMVHIEDNAFTPYVVATWAPMMGSTWSWGHYCPDYQEANAEFDTVAARNAKRGKLS